MSDIYVPIDLTDVGSIIPPNEPIVYSTLFEISRNYQDVGRRYHAKWTSHVLLTKNGIAFTDNVYKKLEYRSWHRVDGMLITGGTGFYLSVYTFKLTRDTNTETKENYERRRREFLVKITPLIIENTEKWLELGVDNPDLKEWKDRDKKKQVQSRQKHFNKIINQYKRIYAKYESELQKEQEKLAKEAEKRKKN
jgi:hypothetical protein